MMVVGKNVIGLLIAMSITSWVGTARIVRGQIMLLRESEYVKASQLLGGGARRIIKKHLFTPIAERFLEHIKKDFS